MLRSLSFLTLFPLPSSPIPNSMRTFNPPGPRSLTKIETAQNVVYEKKCRVIDGVISPGNSGSLTEGLMDVATW